jgi:predicted transcriptional regulator
MVFNGLQKSELVIYNALDGLPRPRFYLTEIECLTGYCRDTIIEALKNLQDQGYITYHKPGRYQPYHFEIKDKARVILNA